MDSLETLRLISVSPLDSAFILYVRSHAPVGNELKTKYRCKFCLRKRQQFYRAAVAAAPTAAAAAALP
jgi:hypothetical protein